MTKRVSNNPSSRELSLATNQLLEGKVNSTGNFTLDTGTSTSVAEKRVGVTSVILFMPLSSSAASDIYSLFVSSQTDGVGFVVTHATGGADRDYRYVILG